MAVKAAVKENGGPERAKASQRPPARATHFLLVETVTCSSAGVADQKITYCQDAHTPKAGAKGKGGSCFSALTGAVSVSRAKINGAFGSIIGAGVIFFIGQCEGINRPLPPQDAGCVHWTMDLQIELRKQLTEEGRAMTLSNYDGFTDLDKSVSSSNSSDDPSEDHLYLGPRLPSVPYMERRMEREEPDNEPDAGDTEDALHRFWFHPW